MLQRLGAWIKNGYINIWDISKVFGKSTVAVGYDRVGVERGYDTGRKGYVGGDMIQGVMYLAMIHYDYGHRT